VRLGESGDLGAARTTAWRALGIPFLFLTAYPVAYLPIDMRDRPKLDKPFDPQVLVDRLSELVQAAARKS
jgi:hypothetical protein